MSFQIRAIALLVLFFSVPASAHTVKTDGDIGVLFHIEPDHNPRAGEPARTWFVLSRSGGAIVPLQECDCRLTVRSDSVATFAPELQPIDAEEHRDIPGVEIVFPEPGNYTLELSGQPQAEAEFSPFAIAYEVTVLPGARRAETQTLPSEATTTDETGALTATATSPSYAIGWIGSAIALLVSLGIGWALARKMKSSQPKSQ